MIEYFSRRLGTDDDSAEISETDQMLNTFYLNIVLFCILGLCFEVGRHSRAIYMNRLTKRFIKNDRVPPLPSAYPFGWVWAILNVSDEDFLRMIGLDAYMLMRFISICLRLGIFYCFWGLLVLAPVYRSCPGGLYQWDSFTIANIYEDPHSRALWVPVVFCYLFAGYFCHLMHAEYKHFILKRVEYLESTAATNSTAQAYYTIMVEKVPGDIKSAPALFEFFDKLFPGEVYAVEVALDLKELEELTYRRRTVRNALEKSIALLKATGLRPTMWIHRDYYKLKIAQEALRREQDEGKTDAEPEVSRVEYPKPVAESFFATLTHKIVVDCIEHYTKELDSLNAQVANTQQVYFEQRQKVEEIEEYRILEVRNKLKSKLHNVSVKIGGKLSSAVHTISPRVGSPFNGVAKNSGVEEKEEEKQKEEDKQKEEEKEESMNPIVNSPRANLNTNNTNNNDVNNSNKSSDDTTTNSNSNNNNNNTNHNNNNNNDINNSHNSSDSTPNTHNHGSHHTHRSPSSALRRHSRSNSISESDARNSNYITDINNTRTNSSSSECAHSRPSCTAEERRVAEETLRAEELQQSSDTESQRTVSISAVLASQHAAQQQNSTDINNNSIDQHDSWRSYPMHSKDGSQADDRSSEQQSSNFRAVGDVAKKVFNTGAKVVGAGVGGLAKQTVRHAGFATKGALRGVVEATRALELLTIGVNYKISSTAFVTFKTRKAVCSSAQILLAHEYYNIMVKPAPNPKDVIWSNVSSPQKQINIRTNIANMGCYIGCLFWSIVVTFISAISNLSSIAKDVPSIEAYSNTAVYKFLNDYLAIAILLILLAILPAIFDIVARYYEGIKLESEIQNSIMTRYFYYQLANVFVSVGLGSLANSIHALIDNPASILSILGQSLPSFSIYFTNLVIVKTLTQVPIEMLRFWPLLDILRVSCVDKKKCTRRELRTGAFADPPMLYGWIYPNLMMVLMIMVTYSCIAPFLMPFCTLFFGLAYLMYKYQLLYVYINEEQSGGFMWYAVFNRSMVALICGVLTLLCYLAIRQTYTSGPFYALFPLPFAILLYWRRCDKRFKRPALNLSLKSAIEIDDIVAERQANGEPVPHDRFKLVYFRQPSLAEGKLKPAAYRKLNKVTVKNSFSVATEQDLARLEEGLVSSTTQYLAKKTNETGGTEGDLASPTIKTKLVEEKYFDDCVSDYDSDCENGVNSDDEDDDDDDDDDDGDGGGLDDDKEIEVNKLLLGNTATSSSTSTTPPSVAKRVVGATRSSLDEVKTTGGMSPKHSLSGETQRPSGGGMVAGERGFNSSLDIL